MKDQHFWARAVFTAAVIIGTSFLAAKCAHAQVAISNLPAAAPIVGNEPLPIVQSGVTVRTTPQALGQYILGGPIDIGTYTPTATQGSATPQLASYIRLANVVQVYGSFTYAPTTTGAYFVDLSLPFASSFTQETQCNGSGALRDNSTAYSTAIVRGNTVANRASVGFRVVTDSTAQTVYYTYQYTIQ